MATNQDERDVEGMKPTPDPPTEPVAVSVSLVLAPPELAGLGHLLSLSRQPTATEIAGWCHRLLMREITQIAQDFAGLDERMEDARKFVEDL